MIKDIQELNFPSYATLSSATVTLNDMGDRTISAQVKIDGNIVPDFSYDWEVEFKGERYIQPLRQPQASKGNESMRSTIDLVFYHKTIWQLKRYYFVEMTSTESGTAIADQYIASLGLNLSDFCVAFQKVLDHYFDGEISIDLNPNLDYTKGVQFMSISYSYIWDVLQKMYEVYGVRWHIEGNTIKVGYPSPILSHTFQYGYEGGLLQVERQLQDANIRNSLLGRGGEQNLPAYYFKEAPEGSLFASDPDAIPELANIYFSNLRGKTFRDYVKGWKAKHYGGAPMSEPTEAYTKGYTDIKFNPIEYVEDKESIEKYGLLQGALDNNEEIYPSIQGAPNGEDVVVYVEPVTSDDVEQSVGKAETIALNGMSQFRRITREQNGGKIQVVLQSEEFEVPTDSYALTISNNISYNITQGFNPTPIWEGNVLADVTEVVTNNATNQIVDKSSLSKGKYQVVTTFNMTLPIYEQWPSIGSAENITFYAQLGVSTNLQLRKLQDNSTDKWLPTFNIWVKNIWNSTRNSGESDEQYAERVWRPILGDRQGNEAKVVFSSGWLSGHEDYEFTIVDFAYDNSHEHNGTLSEWRLTLNKSDAELEATGKYIPSATTNGQAYAGDTFFFIGIDMPHQYVLWAEERLDNYKASSLNEVSEIQPKWVVRFDKLRLHEEEDNLAEQIVVGGAINLADVRFIDAPALQLYLQSVTYTWNEQTLLYPDIEVVLADTIVPVQNPVAQLQGSIDAINSQLYNIGNVAQTVRKIGDSLYLRKDGVADISKSPTKFVGNVSGNNFRQGKIGGADWGIYRDENGNAIAEFDKIIARKDLEVNNLVINQVSAIGGEYIASAAAMTISRVIETEDAYQCFFDQKGGSIANLFQVNDIAYSQRFDEENNATKYYKRKVVAVDIDSITLSKSQADGNGIPMNNDNIVQMGNFTDTSRQGVIIISSNPVPCISQYQGVNSFTLPSPTTRISPNNNLFTGKTVFEAGSSGLENLEEWADKQQQINNANANASQALSDLNAFKSSYNSTINRIEGQLDKKADTWYQSSDPSQNWTTNDEKQAHIGDLWYNTTIGQSFMWNGTEWVTQGVPDEVFDTIDGKSSIFVLKPESYRANDIWVLEADYVLSESYVKGTWVVALQTSDTFEPTHWKKLDTYADKDYISKLETGSTNLLRNSGFTGDYISTNLKENTSLNDGTQMFSPSLQHWGTSDVVSQESDISQSGVEVVMSNGVMAQTLKIPLLKDEKYIFSFRGKGEYISYEVGSNTNTITLSGSWSKYVERFIATSDSTIFTISGNATLCELQITHGDIVSAWSPSVWDNSSELAYYQTLQYLSNAIKNGSTSILGGLLLSNILLMGNVNDDVLEKNTAGVSGVYSDDTDVAFWAGGTMEQAIRLVQLLTNNPSYQPTESEWATLAKFAATHGGDVFMRGYIYAMGGLFKGAVSIANGKILLNADGSGAMANGAFSWDKDGRISRHYPERVEWIDLKNATSMNHNDGGYFIAPLMARSEDVEPLSTDDDTTMVLPTPSLSPYVFCIMGQDADTRADMTDKPFVVESNDMKFNVFHDGETSVGTSLVMQALPNKGYITVEYNANTKSFNILVPSTMSVAVGVSGQDISIF